MRSPGYVVAGLHSPQSTMRSMADRQRFSTGTIVLLGLLGLLLIAVGWRFTTIISTSSNNNNSSSNVNNESLITTNEPLTVIEPPVEKEMSRDNLNHQVIPANLPQPVSVSAQEPDPDIQGSPLPDIIANAPPPIIEHRDLPPVLPDKEILESSHKVPQEQKVQASFSKATTNNPPDQQPLITSLVTNDQKGDATLKKKFRPFTEEQLADNDYMAGLAHIQKGKMSLGMLELRNALSHSPGHIKAREILAGLFIKAGQGSEAAMLLRKGIELHPEHSQYTKLYSRILIDDGDTQAAQLVLEANRPSLNADPEYYAILAAVYQKLEQFQQAADIYSQLVTLDPKSGVLWMGLGISLEGYGQSKEAMDAYQYAIKSGELQADLLSYVKSRISVIKNQHGKAKT